MNDISFLPLQSPESTVLNREPRADNMRNGFSIRTMAALAFPCSLPSSARLHHKRQRLPRERRMRTASPSEHESSSQSSSGGCSHRTTTRATSCSTFRMAFRLTLRTGSRMSSPPTPLVALVLTIHVSFFMAFLRGFFVAQVLTLGLRYLQFCRHASVSLVSESSSEMVIASDRAFDVTCLYTSVRYHISPPLRRGKVHVGQNPSRHGVLDHCSYCV